MSSETPGVPLISVVAITYMRVALLRDTITTFRENTAYPRLEYIVSDDASAPEVQAEIRTLPFDKFLLGERNEGLGRNTNRGIQAARGDLIFQLQDDWRCHGPADFLERALELLNLRSDVGLVRYEPMLHEPPYERIQLTDGCWARVYENGHGESVGEFPYTDRPHLKRRALHEVLGPYLEGVPMTRMEMEFRKRLDQQARFRVGIVEGYGATFEHTGVETSFNPTLKRRALRNRLLANPLTRWPMRLYLRLRGRAE